MTLVRIRSRRLVATLLTCLALSLLAAITATPARAATCDEVCKLAAATSYIDALVTHDASAVPLAPHATRVENGIPTGFSGEGIRANLEDGFQYAIIQGWTMERASVRGDVVTTVYLLDLGHSGVSLGTSRVHEQFVVRHGLITRITATFTYQLP